MKLTGITPGHGINGASASPRTESSPTFGPCRLTDSGAGLPEEAVFLLAMSQLHELPEFDPERVAEIRGDLESGRIRFNADEVVELILQHHGISS